jgi:hypothetical protein
MSAADPDPKPSGNESRSDSQDSDIMVIETTDADLTIQPISPALRRYLESQGLIPPSPPSPPPDSGPKKE